MVLVMLNMCGLKKYKNARSWMVVFPRTMDMDLLNESAQIKCKR